MAYKVMIANPDLWPSEHSKGLSREAARKAAREWNRARNLDSYVVAKDAVSGQAYIEEED